MFVSKNALRKHFNKAGHGRRDHDTKPAGDEQQITIRGAAHAPAPLQYHYDHAALDAPDPSPCVVCNKHFNTKRQFFAHLGGGQHWRSAKYVQKRNAEGHAETRLIYFVPVVMLRYTASKSISPAVVWYADKPSGLFHTVKNDKGTAHFSHVFRGSMLLLSHPSPSQAFFSPTPCAHAVVIGFSFSSCSSNS
jgi:hypothetical protein